MISIVIIVILSNFAGPLTDIDIMWLITAECPVVVEVGEWCM